MPDEFAGLIENVDLKDALSERGDCLWPVTLPEPEWELADA